MSAAKPSATGTIILVADVIPDGGGNYLVKARKPHGLQISEDGLTQWIPTSEARTILGLSRAGMFDIRQTAFGKKHLRWKFTTDKKGKLLWDAASVLACVEATKEIGK